MKTLGCCSVAVLVIQFQVLLAYADESAPAPDAPQPQLQPPPPSQPQPAPPINQVPDGQWVSTQQYGWIWIPYAQADTYISPAGSPYEYAYYPSIGWRWLYAPWVYGWGPLPHWGIYGPNHFAWYAHSWFTRPGYLGSYRGGYRGGGYARGGGLRGGTSEGAMRSGGRGGHR